MLPTPIDAQPPFDLSAKTDVILISSDNVHFFVLKSLLGFSSPHFERMLNSLQPPMDPVNEKRYPLPSIKLTEKSKTLQNFLPFFYPGIPPRVGNLDDILNVMAAGYKYDVDIVAKHMSQELLNLPIMTEDPLRMFALAFHYGWEAIGRAAAKNTLAISVSDLKFSSDLAYISGTQAYQLSRYRLECISAIRDSLLGGQFSIAFNDPEKWLPISKPRSYPINPQVHKRQSSQFPSEDCIVTLLPEDVMIDASCVRDRSSSPSGVKWWVAYIRELFREVEARPRASTVLDNRLSDIAIQRAMQCVHCCQYVHKDIANFKHQFAENIEEVVSKVVLNVDFSGSKFSKIEKSSGSDV